LTAYELLSLPIRKFIRSQEWAALRPIQVAAIERIIQTDDNYILSARTASGKTEAAFLPILSLINAEDPGVQVLYVSPLIALINDQFFRIEELTKHLDIRVTKWHGEASRSDKMHLLKDPSGILFITPESIEALFVNRPAELNRLFGNIKFVIVDEIHSFVGTNRGVQLQSLISRIRQFSANTRYVGLSATIGSYDQVKAFFGFPEKTKVLRDNTKQPVEWHLQYHPSSSPDLPEDLLDSIYELVKDQHTLIFPNSRGRVEEIAVKLKKRAELNGSPLEVFAHHSSVDREVREFVERFAKSARRRVPFAIVCTSTLELGIDIGAVDLIVQIDSTGSVSSLSQRLGRSGRAEGSSSNLGIEVTDEWHLLQSVAAKSLLEEGILEPTGIISEPYDIVFHQILSILRQFSGLPRQDLVEAIRGNSAFRSIKESSIAELIDRIIADDYIQDLRRELIVGFKAEKLVNSKEFYSVFDREDNIKVYFGDKPIGELEPSPDLKPGVKVYLAAQIWIITDVDLDKKKLWVKRSPDARKPKWLGHGIPVHHIVRQRMLSVLYGNNSIPQLSDAASSKLLEMRRIFQSFGLVDLETQRPVSIKPSSHMVYTFTSTAINRTLGFCLNTLMQMKASVNDHHSSIEIENVSDMPSLMRTVAQSLSDMPNHLMSLLEEDEKQFAFGKWAQHLPLDFKHKILLNEHFDVDGAVAFCSNTRFELGSPNS
jgi:ATP-dependent Lhr-like helicase